MEATSGVHFYIDHSSKQTLWEDDLPPHILAIVVATRKFFADAEAGQSSLPPAAGADSQLTVSQDSKARCGVKSRTTAATAPCHSMPPRSRLCRNCEDCCRIWTGHLHVSHLSQASGLKSLRRPLCVAVDQPKPRQCTLPPVRMGCLDTTWRM